MLGLPVVRASLSVCVSVCVGVGYVCGLITDSSAEAGFDLSAFQLDVSNNVRSV